MFELAAGCKTTIAILIYVTVPFVYPCLSVRKNLEEHYREWIATGSYWTRAYYKWIVGDRVFYKDEFWSDFNTSLASALAFPLVAAFLLDWIAPTLLYELRAFFIPTILASFLLRFVFVQFERVRRIDIEIAHRMESDATFDPTAKLHALFAQEHHWITRVVGKHREYFLTNHKPSEN